MVTSRTHGGSELISYVQGGAPQLQVGLEVGITMVMNSITCSYKTYKYSCVTRGPSL